jgi:hypothetical protein
MKSKTSATWFKKILILSFCFISLTSCFKEIVNTPNEKTEIKKIEENPKEIFGSLSKYIKENITDSETSFLELILKERIELHSDIKEILDSSIVEKKDEIYISIVSKRKNLNQRISKYIPEERVQSFKKYNDKINLMIKNKLDNK